jgi:hypothetical protein
MIQETLENRNGIAGQGEVMGCQTEMKIKVNYLPFLSLMQLLASNTSSNGLVFTARRSVSIAFLHLHTPIQNYYYRCLNFPVDCVFSPAVFGITITLRGASSPALRISCPLPN